jgi:hypothetical protein
MLGTAASTCTHSVPSDVSGMSGIHCSRSSHMTGSECRKEAELGFSFDVVTADSGVAAPAAAPVVHVNVSRIRISGNGPVVPDQTFPTR